MNSFRNLSAAHVTVILADLPEPTPFTAYLPAQTTSIIHLFLAVSGHGIPSMKVRHVPLVSTHLNNNCNISNVLCFYHFVLVYVVYV